MSTITQLIKLLILPIIIVGINLLASYYYYQVDLTEDKRFTLSENTKAILEKVDAEVEVTVTFGGDLPPKLVRLRRAVLEMLENFSNRTDRSIVYTVIDPDDESDEKTKSEFFNKLSSQGITPVDPALFDPATERSREIIFPGALIRSGDKEVAVNLLKGNKTSGPDEIINQSVENLEYELISAVKQLTTGSKQKIAFINGHREAPSITTYGAASALAPFYEVSEIRIDTVRSFSIYDMLIITGPKTPYSEAEKFKIDQFIMRGGKALFFLDGVDIALDSIGQGSYLPLPVENNLRDLLFRYGARVNPDLIRDLYSGYIPLDVGQLKLVNWDYFPLINRFGDHPAVRNLGSLQSKFISTIDTVKAAGIKKTPLLFTSSYAKKVSSGTTVDFEHLREKEDPRSFNQGPIPVAWLLEGSFHSAFEFIPFDLKNDSYLARGEPSKILVCSDADIITNDVNYTDMYPYPLGYDKYTRNQFANKDFLLAIVNYFSDENGIILLRNKEIALRPLDPVKVKEEKFKMQVINLAVPLTFIVLFGLIFYFIRKNKYAVKAR